MPSGANAPNHPSVIDTINNSVSTKDSLDQVAENLRAGDKTTNPNAATAYDCDPDDASVGLYTNQLELDSGNTIDKAEGFIFYSQQVKGTGAAFAFTPINIPVGYRFKLQGYNIDTNNATAADVNVIFAPTGASAVAPTGSSGLNNFGYPLILLGQDTVLFFASGGGLVPGGFSIFAFISNIDNTTIAILTVYGVLTKDDNTRKERADTW